MPLDFKSGFVAIIGRPNVGKSTLINALVNQMISITSSKPQTTRENITGIYTDNECQIVLLDTPGIHAPKDLLSKRINDAAKGSLIDLDAIIYIVDDLYTRGQNYVIDLFKDLKTPVILVINKIDLLTKKSAIDKIILSYMEEFQFHSIIPISSTKKTHFQHLLSEIKSLLPQGPLYYPKDLVTDQSDEKRVAEIIRQKILFHTLEEIPYSVAVIIESMKYNQEFNTIDCSAVIICERPSQKGIIIGKQGELLKKVGSEARRSINNILDHKIHLELWVKVEKNWKNDASKLAKYGYYSDN